MKDYDIKISIVVPSFNEEKNISRCLDSILDQTFKNLEVICVDDNSTDSTFDIIKEYSLKDNRIKPFKNPSKGVSSARNFGVENSCGDYIGFVDSDDFIQPQMYEFLLRAISENNCELVTCRYEKTSQIKKKIFQYNCRECFAEEFINFFDSDFVAKNELTLTSACMKLISRKLIEKCESFSKYKIGEDTIYCADLWIKAGKVFLVDCPLYCYYTNTESVSYTEVWHQKWFDLIETRFIAYEKFKQLKNSVTSSFYLERGMKLLLSYRFNIKGTENENKFKKPIKNYFKKYLKVYLKCSDISSKNKLFVSVFSFFPFLYTAFRKMTDSTL
ncbi:MAG: glycosyltransferase family 2 protein [Clostridia bacterium]|nr:glycosyltransferase family 2 protein [Clostridia bacterium]